MSPSHAARNAPMWVTIALLVLAVAFAVAGVLYFADSAAHLPSLLPGHQAGVTRKHVKHGLLAVVLAVAALAGAWLSSGRKKS